MGGLSAMLIFAAGLAVITLERRGGSTLSERGCRGPNMLPWTSKYSLARGTAALPRSSASIGFQVPLPHQHGALRPARSGIVTSVLIQTYAVKKVLKTGIRSQTVQQRSDFSDRGRFKDLSE